MAAARRVVSPPILTLLDAVDAHRGAFEYEWRARFGLPWSQVPSVMGWGEAYRCFVLLARDPSSWVAAEIAGWQYPASREVLAVSDLIDITGRAAWGRKYQKNYVRPWDERPTRHGTGRRTVKEWAEFKARKQAEFRRRRG